jgi:alpha-L-fucosidase
MGERYEPTWESIDAHEVPAWYEDAKLGVFVHWYPNAVPGYGFGWYAHDMHEEDHEIHEYHRENYGAPTPDAAEEGEPVFEYRDFVRETEKARNTDAPENFRAEHFDPEAWADLFEAAGARYVVPVAEHHDGFPMWDAEYTEWTAAKMGPERDVIGELAAAVRDRGMKFAGSHHRLFNYYDPRYTGQFGHPGFDADDGPDEAWVEEYHETMRRLFDHHRPDILWLDGDWAAPADQYRTKELVADYYALAEEWDKEVVVNDRLGRTRWSDDDPHGDFYTPEYARFDVVVDHKWESNRGLGDAWTYDHTETDDDLIPTGELVRNFVDVVSKNGNMLINVGPRPDGTIPEIQRARLRGLGGWLDINGEAVYGTHYWIEAEDDVDGVEVRYTTKANRLFAIFFAWPGETATLELPPEIEMDDGYAVELLTADGRRTLDWEVAEGEVTIELPADPPAGEHAAYAYAISIEVVDPGVDAFESVCDDVGELDHVVTSTEELKAYVEESGMENYSES